MVCWVSDRSSRSIAWNELLVLSMEYLEQGFQHKLDMSVTPTSWGCTVRAIGQAGVQDKLY